jgi:hypothetical protein
LCAWELLCHRLSGLPRVRVLPRPRPPLPQVSARPRLRPRFAARCCPDRAGLATSGWIAAAL